MLSLKDFDEYQEEARKTAIYPNLGHNLYYPTLGLCGESGEVAEKVKKILRDDGGMVSEEKRAMLVKELGDVLWYVANLAEELNVSLGLIAEMNLSKLSERKDRGKIHGEGDNR
jgi:NTP pyrophosphatase (non-canonical NTP hydrolase)